MPSAYDAIVIGAGVMGASVAFHLAKAGYHNTLVLERNRVCSGNTRKSGALVRMHYSNRPEASLAQKSLHYFHNWSDEVGGACGFRKVGFLLLVGPENRDKLVHNVAMQQELGINTRLVEADDLREVQPGINLEDDAIGAFEADSGYADPIATTYSFIRTAFNLGVTILEDTSVTAIRHSGGRVVGVSSTEGDFDAPIVVCAANIWSPELLAPLGIDLGLWALRSGMEFYKRPPDLQHTARVVLDLAKIAYSRPNGDGEYLIGSPLKDEERIDPDTIVDQNDPEQAAWIRDRMAWRLPPLAVVEHLRGQAGVYDMSPDTRAILDRAPGVEGLYLAAGFSGSGFKISPMVGACLAELAVEGHATSADIRPFRFSRFAENDPIRGEHEYSLPASWGMKW